MDIKNNRVYRLEIGDNETLVYTVKQVAETLWDCQILETGNNMYLNKGEIGRFDIGWFAEELGTKAEYEEYFVFL